ncbi:MAG: hypothetical protein IPG67_00805 [Acidobacteria bacterium]|nr:hypothetical protein [Acidobacteriota bacterium]
MNKFRLIAGFAAILLSSIIGAAQDETRSAATWSVQKYDIQATLPAAASDRSLTSKTVLTLKNVSGKPASTLTLRISTLAAVSEIRINESVVEFSRSESTITPGTSLQRCVVRIPAVSAGGIITAVVDYKLTLKDNSGLNTISPTASHFLPLSFWYPTPNSWFSGAGADNATVRVKVNAASGVSYVGSGVEAGGVFEQKFGTQPFFATGNWDVSNVNGVAIYAPKGTSADGQKRAAEMASILTEARTFATAYLGNAPDVPLRIVAARRGAGFSSAGTVLVDESVFRRSKVDSLTTMNLVESAVRTWIGGSITATGDGYGIIREGLTRYIATEFIESKFGKDVADVERLRQRTAYSAISKRDAPMSRTSPLDDFYYPEVANKGAMAWRLLEKRVGTAEFSKALKSNAQDGDLLIFEMRNAFSAHKDLVEYLFDQVTEMNLLVGLPQISGGEARIALRNTGSIDATVNVRATLKTGPPMDASSTVKSLSFGEVVFKTNSPILRVEIDTEKLYPQIEYSDDIAPRESTDSDPVLAVKRLFDKQDYAAAEGMARVVLRDLPRLDEVRILLGRALLALNRNAEAEREFRAVLDERSPTSRSIGWANVGLAQVSSAANQNDAAAKYAETAIVADADYGASFAARNLRNKIGDLPAVDAGVKAFFTDFDRAAASNRKADLEALFIPGEAAKFVSGISGSTEQWQTQVRGVDRLDPNNVLVETSLNIKLLTKDSESGTAVYRLIKIGSGWKIAAVEMFEVR